LRLIFVDEFQDINRAQEAILCALGREGAEANRFLVGDIKQSIYRFRLADPRIFLHYQRAWESEPGAKVIWLSDNFRSHPSILDFVNEVFATLMRRELGALNTMIRRDCVSENGRNAKMEFRRKNYTAAGRGLPALLWTQR